MMVQRGKTCVLQHSLFMPCYTFVPFGLINSKSTCNTEIVLLLNLWLKFENIEILRRLDIYSRYLLAAIISKVVYMRQWGEGVFIYSMINEYRAAFMLSSIILYQFNTMWYCAAKAAVARQECRAPTIITLYFHNKHNNTKSSLT